MGQILTFTTIITTKIVQKIPKGAVREDEPLECPICFEEFEVEQEVATLDCLCRFHRHCIQEWFQKGKTCPVHENS